MEKSCEEAACNVLKPGCVGGKQVIMICGTFNSLRIGPRGESDR